MTMYSGSVTEGSQKATALGYPTVNIPLDDPYISGSYAARVTVEGKTYDAVAYANQERRILEANIFDFNERLYEVTISIELLDKIRESEPFGDDDETARSAIRHDIEKAKAYFAELRQKGENKNSSHT